MRYTLTFALLALTLAPLRLAAQTPEARIQAAQARAASAGIPVSLLESRVAEGRAKGIPMERIAAAVERRAASLQEARSAMSRSSVRLTAADLNAGADAVEAGIEGRALHAVIEQARVEDRPVAIAVLTYLHGERGLPVDEALKRVSDAIKKGPEALRTLPAQAEAESRGRGRGRGGDRPDRAGKGGRIPEGVPAPGQKPGSGKPDRPEKGGKGKGRGRSGGGL